MIFAFREFPFSMSGLCVDLDWDALGEGWFSSLVELRLFDQGTQGWTGDL